MLIKANPADELCYHIEFNRFDICEAYYLIAMDYNPVEGVQSRLNRLRFRPSPLLGNFNDLTENAQEIYRLWQERNGYTPEPRPEECPG